MEKYLMKVLTTATLLAVLGMGTAPADSEGAGDSDDSFAPPLEQAAKDNKTFTALQEAYYKEAETKFTDETQPDEKTLVPVQKDIEKLYVKEDYEKPRDGLDGRHYFAGNGCHQPLRGWDDYGNPNFRGLQINEVRYVRGEEQEDITCRPFIELKGPPGMAIGELRVNIFRGDLRVRTFQLPAAITIPGDGYLLISNHTTVKDNDARTDIMVDYRDRSYTAWDWLPKEPDSGVTIILDDPVAPGDRPEVVDSVRYNPSGTPAENPQPNIYLDDGLLSWWEPGDLEDCVGERHPAPGLPYYSRYDPVWGISRVGESDSCENALDFLVASVTPGRGNETLWFDTMNELSIYSRPTLNEVMPNTNGFADEGTFVEICGPSGLRWNAGPGQYELIAFKGGTNAPHGDRTSWTPLVGSIPGDNFFVAADTSRLPDAYGGGTPDQQIECGDLRDSGWNCNCGAPPGCVPCEWNWLNNYRDAGIRLEYWITSDRRIIVDSLRWSPDDERETENLFRQGEGLAPLDDSSPATSFCRLWALDTHFNRNDFVHSDPSPGQTNVGPEISGEAKSRYPDDFTELGVRPTGWNGKVVLFDQTKKQKAGPTGHWIITDDGDYSDWAWQLFRELHYEVRAAGTGNPSRAETLTAAELAGVDVLVIGEPQADYTAAEHNAVQNFISRGGSLFFLANHQGSDRDHNGVDSWDVWNASLNMDSLTGVSLAPANCIGENIVLMPPAAATAHPINNDITAPPCTIPSTGCTLFGSILFRETGVGLYSGAFVSTGTLPRGVSVVELLEGERPSIERDPCRLDSYGGAQPIETYAVAIQMPSGGRIVLLGDSAVLNDGGSSDYATYAATMAYCAYGTDRRNALFGLNTVNWLANRPPVNAVDVEPSLEQGP